MDVDVRTYESSSARKPYLRWHRKTLKQTEEHFYCPSLHVIVWHWDLGNVEQR